MKTRAVILAGGEGSRLGILTAKRTKPSVPFAGKYRIIDFALSNCVNSGIIDVMIIAQYRPHSMIEHIGAGGPWDLNLDFTGGVRIYSPYKARGSSDWFLGTADAVQQNFRFVKSTRPELILILAGDHIYSMNYDALVAFHRDHQADVTIGTIRVPKSESNRFGIVGVGDDYQVTSFIEKPKVPPSNMANMGVYLFNLEVLDKMLWEDHMDKQSSHDFGKDILPKLVARNARVFAYPYSGYWVDVGTISAYWQAHMDLISGDPKLNLNDRTWIIHTRTEERPPVFVSEGAHINDSMVADGCIIESGAKIERSVLSPGVYVESGAVVRESILLTDVHVESNATLERVISDKRVRIGKGSKVGGILGEGESQITLIGKSSILPPAVKVHPGATIDTDVTPADFQSLEIFKDEVRKQGRITNAI
jgi:glucose-1-phosphate adenylyltransferase